MSVADIGVADIGVADIASPFFSGRSQYEISLFQIVSEDNERAFTEESGMKRRRDAMNAA